ncbi:carboxypeptidase-like regulatory domain-containing protein [uncultured Psychroserpens sp.]|uniref:carboxypeptidase-like regulatory domain-containing protein n=1 Tax=uncultured Psychroserpens sp. TaxID=255436 RepID=UPI00263970D3|nr:carboxypeptidase-like regulatory domain-containing protein [uncultured Psychroserpens sp.]
MRILIVIISFCGSFTSVFGQDISSEIRNSKTQLPIQYVNIGIAGKNIGTVSDSLGCFKLSLTNTLNADTLRISAIGYKTKNYSVGSLRIKPLQKTILLDEEVIQLKEVIVSNKIQEALQLGLKRKYCYPIPLYKKVSGKVTFPQKNCTHEIGTRFTNKNTLKLDSVQINFAECHLENLKFRLNVYTISENNIENVLQQPIYISLTKAQVLHFPMIDLTDYNINMESDFLITIENYKKIPNGSLSLLANAKSKGRKFPTYYRDNSHGKWTRLTSKKSKPFGISIISYVTQY